ncbi:homogentisate 12-dioxygenase [Acidimicrobium ferrooxidans DSM 10331]|uniref:Homogentisate 12-dioxygenase n=1 Tax=Acidimicrobium ferrooxidans (strain DSM 10331 / JCM 15462 / NBRC 103882 / ICP) TaxID=525909 RepID=C7LYF0_ACIFD|nr:homogentisate 1,2-dioxygenase [Acidimicrobium ferrooxidans]ACU53758.1 homogentisate 12-dioxygenase [Acidimicrobium ferrooxidans DSM 10331]
MPYYRRVGEVPRKRHQYVRAHTGARIAEELMGKEGFAAESSLLYHLGRPTAIVDAAPVAIAGTTLVANRPLLPRHLRTPKLAGLGGDAATDRHLLLGNDDVWISWVVADRPSSLQRHAVGDECYYVHRGTGACESVFGTIRVGPGDYLVLPASTTYRLVPDEGSVLECLVLEARGHIEIPDRYLSQRGQLLEAAPLCERDLRGPEGPLVVEGEDVDVIVRTRLDATRYTYATHPFDVVGWDGCCYPFAFQIRDFEPIVKRFHAPPPVHQTFAGPNFVVCSFVPRPFDFDPEAVAVPYHHANVDSDEVLFYADGNFMSRAGSGIEAGSISLHPSGFVHGPQPGSVDAARGQPGTEEVAVMVDTFRPLMLSETALAIDDDAYPWTWSRRGPGAQS